MTRAFEPYGRRVLNRQELAWLRTQVRPLRESVWGSYPLSRLRQHSTVPSPADRKWLCHELAGYRWLKWGVLDWGLLNQVRVNRTYVYEQ